MLFTESFSELYKTTSYVFSCHCSSFFSLVIFCEFLQLANLSSTIHSFKKLFYLLVYIKEF